MQAPTRGGLTEQQKLASGVIGLLLATICILSLPILGSSGMVVGSVLGLLTVAGLVIATLSIGTSAQPQV